MKISFIGHARHRTCCVVHGVHINVTILGINTHCGLQCEQILPKERGGGLGSAACDLYEQCNSSDPLTDPKSPHQGPRADTSVNVGAIVSTTNCCSAHNNHHCLSLGSSALRLSWGVLTMKTWISADNPVSSGFSH